MEILYFLASIIVAFAGCAFFFTWRGERLFKVPPASQFASLRDYRDFSAKLSTRCRDSHMLEAGAIALACGLISCYFLGVYFLPTVGSVVTLLAVWLVMTYEFRPELRQDYVVKSNLITATGVAFAIGIVVSVLAGASLLPVLIALALFWAAWVVLMPM